MVFFQFHYSKFNIQAEKDNWPAKFPISISVESESYMEGLFKILSLAELEGGFDPDSDELYVTQSSFVEGMKIPSFEKSFQLKDPMAPFRKEAENG